MNNASALFGRHRREVRQEADVRFFAQRRGSPAIAAVIHYFSPFFSRAYLFHSTSADISSPAIIRQLLIISAESLRALQHVVDDATWPQHASRMVIAPHDIFDTPSTSLLR